MDDTIDDPLAQNFGEHVDIVYQSLDTLAGAIERASDVLAAALLDDRKLLVCGTGTSAALGHCFTALLLNRIEQERPSLPIITLGADTSTLTAITTDFGFAEIYSRQINAVGQRGDVLIIISETGSNLSLVQALGAAHEREIPVIALTGAGGGDIASLLFPEDIELRVPSDIRARVSECHLLFLHSLASMVEGQLFGV